MCDPITALVVAGGALGAKMLAPKAPSYPAQPDPAVERAASEASAAQAANASIADAKRSKRLNALSLGGATADTLGQSKGTSVLGGGASTSAF